MEQHDNLRTYLKQKGLHIFQNLVPTYMSYIQYTLYLHKLFSLQILCGPWDLARRGASKILLSERK